MQLLFLSAFVIGLVLAVYSMLNGVERAPAKGAVAVDALGRALATARTSLKIPTMAAALTVFGVVGYLLTRYSTLGAPLRFGMAFCAGALGVGLAVLLIARWIIPAARNDVVDERYLLQGHFARVTRSIGEPDGVGAIEYQIDGTSYAASACSVDGTSVAADTDVVIERVEQGVAFVEPWIRVEQRI